MLNNFLNKHKAIVTTAPARLIKLRYQQFPEAIKTAAAGSIKLGYTYMDMIQRNCCDRFFKANLAQLGVHQLLLN